MELFRKIVRGLAVAIFVISALYLLMTFMNYYDEPQAPKFIEDRANTDFAAEFTGSGKIAGASALAFALTFVKKRSGN